ncbi:MAG: 50S ribosomal protein L3 [Candidatus Omnitrophica bacterium]|nr:50S ribosomal protein L3 [Candidatus Omnitrophota bacterium]
MKGILGKKIGMTQLYTEDGVLIPVTIVEAGPCAVIQIKTESKDKYNAIKLGFDDIKEKRAVKAKKSIFKKAKSDVKRFIREIRLDSVEGYEVGHVLKADIFSKGEYVDVTGMSKGKGFQGGMKRWNWTAGKAGHGSMHHRRVGSIGGSSFPSRVHKGKTMPGQLGNEKVTSQNLEIINVDKEASLMAIKGAIAGHNNSYIVIKSAKKKQTKQSEKNKK